MQREERLYQERFGQLPNEQMERVKYILGKRAENEKYAAAIAAAGKKLRRIKWKKLNFILWKVPRPSARPRATRNRGYLHLYVPRAEEEGKWFEAFAKANQLPFIETPCILNLTIYEKTPDSWSISKRVLAELGCVRPWKRTGDFDNYAKGIADFIQHGLLKDDCLVIDSRQQLYYSIKPHIVVELQYMERFPEILK
jgi:Holliday junction resolvase RusA-like endonuclease